MAEGVIVSNVKFKITPKWPAAPALITGPGGENYLSEEEQESMRPPRTKGPQLQKGQVSVWQDFIAVQDPDELRRFLNLHGGRWYKPIGGYHDVSPSTFTPEGLALYWEEQKLIRAVMVFAKRRVDEHVMQLLQERFDRVVIGPTEQWGGEPFAVTKITPPKIKRPTKCRDNGIEPAEIEVQVEDASGFVYMSVWLDLLKRIKYGFCKYERCNHHSPQQAPFEVGHKRKEYCCDSCRWQQHMLEKRRKAKRRSSKKSKLPSKAVPEKQSESARRQRAQR